MRDIGAPHAPQKRREGFFIYWDIRVQGYGGLPPVSSAGIANYLYDQKPHRPRALTTGMVFRIYIINLGKAGFSLGPKKTRRLCKSASGEYLYLYVQNRRASGAARCRGVSWIEKKCPIMCPTIDSTIYFIWSLRVP